MTCGSGFPIRDTKKLEIHRDFAEKLSWERCHLVHIGKIPILGYKLRNMTPAKLRKTLMGLLTLVGGLFVATAAVRSSETAKAQGTTFAKAFGQELKILTKTS